MRERSEAAKEFLSSRFIGREDRDRCSFKTDFQETDFEV